MSDDIQHQEKGQLWSRLDVTDSPHYHKRKRKEEKKLPQASSYSNAEEFISLISDGLVDINCELNALGTTPLMQGSEEWLVCGEVKSAPHFD